METKFHGRARSHIPGEGRTALTDAYSYDVFGNLRVGSAAGEPFLFTGQQFDNKARDIQGGLYYLRNRVYDPSIGRFLTRDSLSGSSSSPQSQNRYAYVENNPVNRVDPTGMDSELVTGECLNFGLALATFAIVFAISVAYGPFAGIAASIVTGAIIAAAQEANGNNNAANTTVARAELGGVLVVLNQIFGGRSQGAYQSPPIGLGNGPGRANVGLQALFLGLSGYSCGKSV